MPGLGLNPLAASAMGANLAAVPEEQAGLQLKQAQASIGQSQAQEEANKVQGGLAMNQAMGQAMQGQQPSQDPFENFDQQIKARQQAAQQLPALYGDRKAALMKEAQDLQGQKTQLALSRAATFSQTGNTEGLRAIAQRAFGMNDVGNVKLNPDTNNFEFMDSNGNPISSIPKKDLDTINATPAEKLAALWHQGVAVVNGQTRENVAETQADAKKEVERLKDLQAKDAVGKVWEDQKNGWITPGQAADREKFLNTVKGLNGSGQQIEKLSPDALRILAQEFHMYGDSAFAHLGNRLAATAIPQARNMEAEMYGTAARNYVAGGAELKANTNSLIKLTAQRDAVSAFEKTALANGQKALEIGSKIVDTGSPFFNEPIRKWEKRMMGDKDVATFHAALDVFAKEVARVTSNPNLTGQLTDNQIKEIKALTGEDATMGMLKDIYGLYKFDMAQRHSNLDQTIDKIKENIKPIPAGAGGGSAAPEPAAQDFGPAPAGMPEGHTGMRGTQKVKIVNGRIVAI